MSSRGIRTAGALAAVRGGESLARRIASQAAARQRTRDAAMIAGRVVAAPPRSIVLRRPSRYRTGGYSFASQGGKELNFLDTPLAATVIDTTGAITLLNGMVQGTSASQRIGRKISIKSIQLRLQHGMGSTGLSTMCRVAIVLDLQSNGAAPAWLDVFDNSTSLSAPHTMRNISNAGRFKVLWSHFFTLTGSNASGLSTDDTFINDEWYKRCDIPVNYNAGVAGTVGDIQTGGLFYMTLGSTAAGTAAASTTGTIRIRYAD